MRWWTWCICLCWCFWMIQEGNSLISSITYLMCLFILEPFDRHGRAYHPTLFTPHTPFTPAPPHWWSTEVCLCIFNARPTLSHFSIRNFWHKHAGALCRRSKIRERKKRAADGEEESDPVIFQLWMPVFGVSLWLIISFQSFNLGARSGRFKPWKQLALCSPTVRVSFAVDDGNIKPVSREWTSQSESLQLS